MCVSCWFDSSHGNKDKQYKYISERGDGVRLSELILLIEQRIEEHGDLTVADEQEGTLFPAEELIVERASIDDFVEEGSTVARIY